MTRSGNGMPITGTHFRPAARRFVPGGHSHRIPATQRSFREIKQNRDGPHGIASGFAVVVVACAAVVATTRKKNLLLFLHR